VTDLAAPTAPSGAPLAAHSRWRLAPGDRRVVRLPVLRVSLRVEPRLVVVSVLLGLVVVAGVAVALCVGDYPIPLPDVARALAGRGNVDTTFVVNSCACPGR
jgi:iron complex transport system permease protein